MSADQLQALVNSLSAAATNAATAAVAATGTTVTGGYAEVPGGKGGDTDTWDFSRGDGLKLFLHSTKGIEPKYDGKQEGLANFLRKIKRRGETFGWAEVFSIPDSNSDKRSLCVEYGALKSTEVDDEVRTYCFQDKNRRKQGSTVLAKLITESLSDDLLMELLQKEDKFSIVEAGNTGKDHESGAIMLHELINLVEVETRATVANITKQLNNLDVLMQEEKDSDIKNFNVKVDALLKGLRARNQTPPDIITSLFAAYKLAADSKFVEYITRKEEEYEDGTDDLKAEKLMTMALSKYKIYKGRNEWMKKTKQELQFVAMHSELEDAKKRLALATRGGGKGRGGTANATKATEKKDGDSVHRGARPGRPNTGQFAWKGVIPKAGEPHKKSVNGKSYVHCPHHGDTKWVLEFNREGVEHVAGCRARTRAGDDSATSLTSTTSGSNSETPSREEMRLAQALAHVMGDGAADISRLTEDEDPEE